MTLDQLSAAATQSLSCLPIYKEARKRMIADMTGADLDEHIAAVTTEHVIAYLHRTGQLVAVTDDAIERVAKIAAEAYFARQVDAGYITTPCTGGQDWINVAIAAIAAMKGTQP